MKALSIATILAVACFSVLPTLADDSDTVTIHGRSAFAIESALRDRGVVTSGVEAWGGLIRAWVPNGSGGTTMQFFDADTLQPATLSRG